MLNRVATGLRALGAVMPILLRDGAGLCGIGLISYGAWLILPAAGFIACGVLLVTGAMLASAK